MYPTYHLIDLIDLCVQDSAIQSDPEGHDLFLSEQGFASPAFLARDDHSGEFFSLFNKKLARNFTD